MVASHFRCLSPESAPPRKLGRLRRQKVSEIRLRRTGRRVTEQWDGRLARRRWNGKDGRDARPTLKATSEQIWGWRIRRGGF
jgi:hypothetical protein